MREAMRWMFRGVVGLLALVLLLWGMARLMGPDRASRDALALMQQSWDPPGDNAFDAIWLMQYDVPAERLAAIAGADMARIRAASPADADGKGGLSGFTSLAAETSAKETLSKADNALLCNMRDEDCLAKVRGDLAAYEGLIERHQGLLQRHDALAGYGHLRSVLPPRADVPLPEFGTARLAYTRNAVLFARGDVDAALESTCRDFGTWRRLGAQTDMLIANMIGVAYSTGSNGPLFASMLHELPSSHPLPASCREALQPPAEEDLSMCRAMRGEFAFTSQAVALTPEMVERDSGAAPRAALPLLFNADKTKARMALTHASFCGAQAQAKIAADRPFTANDVPTTGYVEFGCIDNAIGCILAAIAAPAYHEYQNRRLDHGARLRALATLLWLRDHRADGKALAKAPVELNGAVRDIELGSEGRTLRVRQYAPRNGEHWEVPLPAYLVDATSD